MLNKQFNTELHEHYDEIGRLRAYKLFKQLYGIELIDNPDEYAVDLIAIKNNKIVGYVEVEVREAWDGVFLYDTLNIPSRKKKLLTNNLPTALVAFNKQGTFCFICKDTVVLASPLIEVKNKYIPNGEFFYKVPVDKIRLITL